MRLRDIGVILTIWWTVLVGLCLVIAATVIHLHQGACADSHFELAMFTAGGALLMRTERASFVTKHRAADPADLFLDKPPATP